MNAVPTWRFLIDWDSDGGLLVGDFEADLDGWDGDSLSGFNPPTLAQSTAHSYHGDTSLLVTWSNAGAVQIAQPDPFTDLIVGRSYTLTAWVWVPSSGGQHARCAVSGISQGSASTLTNQWQQISYTFTATAAIHQLQVRSSATPTAGTQTWIDYVQLVGAGEGITDTPPGVMSSVSIQYGRDQARSVGGDVQPGECKYDVDNVSRELSPENSSSSLNGMLGPGRETVVEATWNSKLYRLYAGFLDDYTIDTNPGAWLAKFSAADGLARFKDTPVSTALYPAVRTGDAINILLDTIGWTGGRDIDPGATTIRWWSAENDDALSELMDIVSSEGPPAFVHMSPTNGFIFRDRHHRLVRADSLTSQATFVSDTAAGAEIEMQDCTIDFGWKDVINRVEFSVTNREPASTPTVVWTNATGYTLADGETRSFTVTAEKPFYAIVTPTVGAPTEVAPEPESDGIPKAGPDWVITGGSVDVTFTRPSGRATTMLVKATGVVTVLSMQLRAYEIEESAAIKVTAQDAASIARYRGVKPYKPTTPWLNPEDAAAVADLILGQRADRLPVVTFTVPNETSGQLVQQLTRDLSDRITVDDPESGFNGECYLETIAHDIDDDGNTIRTTFSAEKIPVLPSGLFTFDLAGAGFNDGEFGPSGVVDPAKVFRFDIAGQGFGQGTFAY